MALTTEARSRITAQIDALKKRLPLDSNDLDYETHLKTIRQLQSILDSDAARGTTEETMNQETQNPIASGANPGSPCPDTMQQETMKQEARDAIDALISRYPALEPCRDSIAAAAASIIAAYKNGGKVITCGNGGSAADAEHIVGELMKGFLKKRPVPPDFAAKLAAVAPAHAEYLAKNLQQPLAAVSLVAGVALPTAFANDQAGDLVFAQQVYGIGRAGDILLAISTSGSSANVIYAVELAKALGITTIALTGSTGGRLKDLADITIAVPQAETYRIQELHLPVYHALCIAAEAEFFPQ